MTLTDPSDSKTAASAKLTMPCHITCLHMFLMRLLCWTTYPLQSRLRCLVTLSEALSPIISPRHILIVFRR